VWLRIDDQIATHRKIQKAGTRAAWLWICSIAYAQNHLTDGFISDDVLGALGVPLREVKHSAKQLVQTALWHRVDGGYCVHDYLKHNISARERRRLLAEKAEAGRVGGIRSGQTRRAQSTATARDTAKHPGEADVKQGASPKRSTPRSRRQAPREALSSPLLSDPVQAGALSARPADLRTNTAGNGAGQPRRVASDAAVGGASAPVAPTQEEELLADVEDYKRDPAAYWRKHGQEPPR